MKEKIQPSDEVLLNGNPLDDVYEADEAAGEVTYFERHWSTGEKIPDGTDPTGYRTFTQKGEVKINKKAQTQDTSDGTGTISSPGTYNFGYGWFGSPNPPPVSDPANLGDGLDPVPSLVSISVDLTFHGNAFLYHSGPSHPGDDDSDLSLALGRELDARHPMLRGQGVSIDLIDPTGETIEYVRIFALRHILKSRLESFAGQPNNQATRQAMADAVTEVMADFFLNLPPGEPIGFSYSYDSDQVNNNLPLQIEDKSSYSPHGLRFTVIEE